MIPWTIPCFGRFNDDGTFSLAIGYIFTSLSMKSITFWRSMDVLNNFIKFPQANFLQSGYVFLKNGVYWP